MSNKNSLFEIILVAAVLISGSLVFWGLQLFNANNVNFDASVQKNVEQYFDEFFENQGTDDTDVLAEDLSDDDPVLGDEDAPVTIVEWSDYECPYCGRFYSETLPQIKEAYIDTGKAKLVYRDFPLSSHQYAMPAALAAECARDQGGDTTYFHYHDLIFENQAELSDSLLRDLAANLGLDTNAFDTCLASEKYKEEVAHDLDDGQAAGIQGTPGFLINGQLVYGAQPFETFKEVIDNALDYE